MPQNLCSDLPMGNFQMEGSPEQVRHNNSFDELSGRIRTTAVGPQ